MAPSQHGSSSAVPGVALLGIHPILEVGPEEFSSLVVKSEREEKLGVPLLQPCCSGWDFVFSGLFWSEISPEGSDSSTGNCGNPGEGQALSPCPERFPLHTPGALTELRRTDINPGGMIHGCSHSQLDG